MYSCIYVCVQKDLHEPVCMFEWMHTSMMYVCRCLYSQTCMTMYVCVYAI